MRAIYVATLLALLTVLAFADPSVYGSDNYDDYSGGGDDHDNHHAEHSHVGPVKGALDIGLLTGPTEAYKDEPGEEENKEGVQAEVPVEVRSDSLPFEPEEAGDHRVFEEVSVVFALPHVEQRLSLRQGMLGRWGFVCLLTGGQRAALLQANLTD